MSAATCEAALATTGPDRGRVPGPARWGAALVALLLEPRPGPRRDGLCALLGALPALDAATGAAPRGRP